MMIRLACVVEGHGEVKAVPVLIRRVAQALDPTLTIQILPPIRTPKSTLVRPDELERASDLAARKLGGHGAILVLIDADNDCPKQLGPQLLARAISAHHDLPMAVVLAKREYEAWFLAAAESLRGQRGLPEDLSSPPHPERIQGAKEWLRDKGMLYSETVDQPALTGRFDLELARRADSFDKCYREITRLIGELTRSTESHE
jgi:hypothetical protein